MDKQMSLVEALLHPKLGANTKLDGMHGQVDWAPIGRLAEKVARAGGDRAQAL